MREIERTTQFKRDYKREAKGRYRTTLDGDLAALLRLLVNDARLPARYRDHALGGEWANYLDCHVKLDLLLIYGKPDDRTLRLVRLGSHSELGF
jgi:mRNA interferase YafQ